MGRDGNYEVKTSVRIGRREFVRGAAATAGAVVVTSALAGCGPDGGAAAGGGGGGVVGGGGGGAVAPTAFTAPDAALVRTLGAVPAGVCNTQVCVNGDYNPAFGGVLKGAGAGFNVPGLGVPLGGIGAGSFMINQCGTFGPWDMGGQQTTGNWEQRTLTQAAFHVREEVVGGGAPTVKTLAVNHTNVAADRRLGTVLPAWNVLNPGDGEHSALWPFTWIKYNAFQATISTRMWSPLIANNDERLSMPIGFFESLVSNPTDKPIKLSMMFTFPNAPAFTTGNASQRVRTGFYSRYDLDTATGIGGVTLGASDPTNSLNSQDSEWVIAIKPFAGQTVSYCTSWNANGDGSDIYAAFSDDGVLPNGNINADASAGAVAVSLTLQPGETQTIRFALAWDFPRMVYGNNTTVWMRRYTEFFGGRRDPATKNYIAGSYPFKQGFNIATKELGRYDDSLAKMNAWWKPIAENASVPAWLRKASLNEMYHITFNGSLWEHGLVSTTLVPNASRGQVPRWGIEYDDTHIYYKRDGGNGGTAQHEMDMDSSGYLGQAKLFRATESGFIVPCIQGVRQNPLGIGRVLQQTFTTNGPFITTEHGFVSNLNTYTALVPQVFGTPPPGTGDLGPVFSLTAGDPFRDCTHKLIYRTYALIKFYNDDNLLKYAYSSMLKALQFSQGFRPAGSRLPMDPPSNTPPNTMDQAIVDGHGIYNCSLYILSLQILSTITPRAKALGVPEATDAVQTMVDTELPAAKAEFETIFWNPATGRYRHNDASGGITGRTGTIQGRFKPALPADAIWLESFPGQTVAFELGLPDLINFDRARIHLNNTLDKFIRFRDPQGRLMGGPIVLAPDGSIYPSSLNTTEVNEVVPGIAFLAAAGAYRIGKKVGDQGIMDKALQLAEGCAIRIYDDENTALAFNSPESWFVDDTSVARFPAYTRTRSVWSMYDAVSTIPVAQPS